MSRAQWAAMMTRRRELRRRRLVLPLRGRRCSDITGFRTSFPRTRGAPRSGFSSALMVKKGDIVPNNTHFDTTRANIEARGATALDLPIAEGPRAGSRRIRSRATWTWSALERVLQENPGQRSAGDADRHQQLRRRPAGARWRTCAARGDLPAARHSVLFSTPAASPKTPSSSSSAKPGTGRPHAAARSREAMFA